MLIILLSSTNMGNVLVRARARSQSHVTFFINGKKIYENYEYSKNTSFKYFTLIQF